MASNEAYHDGQAQLNWAIHIIKSMLSRKLPIEVSKGNVCIASPGLDAIRDN